MKEQHASTSRKPSSQEGFLLRQYTEQCLRVGHIPATERIWSVSCVEHALGPPLRAYAPPLLSCRILALSEDGFCHFEAGKCWWSFFLWLVTMNFWLAVWSDQWHLPGTTAVFQGLIVSEQTSLMLMLTSFRDPILEKLTYLAKKCHRASHYWSFLKLAG